MSGARTFRLMNFRALMTAAVLLMAAPGLQAQDIDLRCEGWTEQLLKRLSEQGLLIESTTAHERAQAIGLELCHGAQQAAQQQHERGVSQRLRHWLFEDTGGKAGNKRLKNLKR